MDDLLVEGKQILESQTFSKLLGANLVALSKKYAELSLPIKDSFKQNYGFVHGGVISYLADNCLTFAGASILGHCVTSEYKINYLMPAMGKELVAKSRVVSFSLRQAVCECKIYAVDQSKESLVAIAQGTIVKIDMEKLK